MNVTYFNFLFVTTIKKRPVWISWLIFLLTACAFLLILPAAANMNPIQLWANTTMPIMQSFLGMAAAIFSAILAIHIFKDGNEEGTELVVFSKPITRIQITLTKFFVFFLFCIIVNITCVLLTAFTIFLPKTEKQFYWKLLLSMFIGNLITFGLFGSLSILLTVKFAKAGVIITDVMLSLIFIIYQILTLFTFKTPQMSILDHNMTATTYMLSDRDMKTGKYTEAAAVNINTKQSNLTTDNPNFSIDWQGTKDYWEKEVNTTAIIPVLNATDIASQVALTYLSAGLGDYSYRQARRNFAISRYYNYELTAPASPEIIREDANAPMIHWAYAGFSAENMTNPLDETKTIQYIQPQILMFAAISPGEVTRLTGFSDKIPVGHFIKSGELLSFHNVYLEPAEWVKYAPAFQVMYDNVFLPKYYLDKVSPEMLENYAMYPIFYASSNQALTYFYELVWACLTGHSTDEKYFGPDSPMKKYNENYLNVHSAADLNERFIQFKYYCYRLALQDQENILAGKWTSTDEEKAVKDKLLDDSIYDPDFTILQDYLGIQYSKNNWFALDSGENVIPTIQPNTRAPAITYMFYTLDHLNKIAEEEGWSHDEKVRVISGSTYSKFWQTAFICNTCYQNEEFLYTNTSKPDRSAAYHGKAYFTVDKWVPYSTTLLAQMSQITGLPFGPSQGHNIQWFFFDAKPTRQYWMYAVIWGVVSIMLFTAGAIVYQKYDVK